jgi:hypothetical protein
MGKRKRESEGEGGKKRREKEREREDPSPAATATEEREGAVSALMGSVERRGRGGRVCDGREREAKLAADVASMDPTASMYQWGWKRERRECVWFVSSNGISNSSLPSSSFSLGVSLFRKLLSSPPLSSNSSNHTDSLDDLVFCPCPLQLSSLTNLSSF